MQKFSFWKLITDTDIWNLDLPSKWGYQQLRNDLFLVKKQVGLFNRDDSDLKGNQLDNQTQWLEWKKFECSLKSFNSITQRLSWRRHTRQEGWNAGSLICYFSSYMYVRISSSHRSINICMITWITSAFYIKNKFWKITQILRRVFFSKGPVIRETFSVQLVAQLCCVASWDGLLRVWPPSCATNFLCCKKETSLLLFATWRFVARGGGNTRNKQSQLATQHCCATSSRKMLPVLLGLKFFLSVSTYFAA